MGRRSRKRMGGGEGAAVGSDTSTRADRDEARRRRAQEASRAAKERDDPRLPAPWGPFPLTELVVLLAIGLLIGAFIVRGERRRRRGAHDRRGHADRPPDQALDRCADRPGDVLPDVLPRARGVQAPLRWG